MAKNKLTSTKSEMIASGRRFSNRHDDNNDDKRCKPEHSECYEKPQRPGERSRINSEKHEVAFAEGHCYTCNNKGHRY